MGIKAVSITELAFDSILTAILVTGYESNKRPYRIVSGLPADAKLVDIKRHSGIENTWVFYFQSASFPEGEDPDLGFITIVSELLPAD